MNTKVLYEKIDVTTPPIADAENVIKTINVKDVFIIKHNYEI